MSTTSQNHSWHSAFIKVFTLGVVNYETGKLIIKDPFTGFGNIIKTVKDDIFHNFNEGVWIGKRVLKDSLVGFSSYLLENHNLNYLHYVVRINGQNWHLC